MSSGSKTLAELIGEIGGPARAAELCQISSRAVYKWLKAGRLPRTEFTGETTYAATLAAVHPEKIDPQLLLDAGKRVA